VNAANTGTATNITAGFSGIENLTGTAGINTFSFEAGGSLSGTASGLGGDDIFDMNSGTAANIDGGAGEDELDLEDAAVSVTVTLTALGSLDGFAGNATTVTGFDNIDEVAGGAGTDTLVASIAAGGTFAIGANGDGTYTSTNTLTFDDFQNLTGGAGDDTFDVNAPHTGNLNGVGGNDTFNLNANIVTGSVTGGAGTDTITGSNDYTVTGANSGTSGEITGGWNTVENLTGTAGADTFTFAAGGSLTGTASGLAGNDLFDMNGGTAADLEGGAGADILDLAGAAANATITLTGTSADGGFAGDSTSVTGFDSIDEVEAGGGTDTLIADIAAGGQFLVQAGDDEYTSGGETLLFNNVENLTGADGADTFTFSVDHTGAIDGAGGDDVFTFNGGTIAGTVNGNTGNDTFDVNGGTVTADLDGAAGNDTFTFDGGTVSGDLTGDVGENVYDFGGGTVTGNVNVVGVDIWNHTPGDPLGSSVTGTGALMVPDAGGGDLTVGGGDLVLPTLTGFTGHLILGGTIDPPTVPFDANANIVINTDLLTVNDPIATGGDITLLASNIDLNNSISAGGIGGEDIALVAVGDGNGGSPTGNITAVANPTSIQGGSLILVAADTIVNPEQMEIELGGGELAVQVGSGDTITFGFLDATPATVGSPLGNSLANLLNSLFASGVFFTSNVDLSTFQQLSFGQLIGLQQLAFIDVGLFEEDLQLFGIIGQGVALALAQCEEVEGCAPDVSEDELNQLIEQLAARVAELERRIAEATSDAEKQKLQTLLDGYRRELENFRNYQRQLKEYYSAPSEEDAGGDEFGEEGEGGDVATQVKTLSDVLEITKKRIDWLEGLKADADARARLSESTGIELTIEALDEIIDATRQEVIFIERMIQLLLEGPQAQVEPPVFWAESSDDQTMVRNIGFGPSLLKLDEPAVASTGRWY
jgi:hypothetical protein